MKSIRPPSSSSSLKLRRRWFATATALLSLAGTALAADPLTWSPPVLNDPVTILVSNANHYIDGTVAKLPDGSTTSLAGRDCLFVFTQPVTAAGGLKIEAAGARHIVIVGGEINIPYVGTYPPTGSTQNQYNSFNLKRRGMYVTGDWSGTLHLEGMWLHSSANDMNEGMEIDGRGTAPTAQIENLVIDNVHSRQEQLDANWGAPNLYHPDIIQNFGGPAYYRIDRLTGSSDYQGLFLAAYGNGAQSQLCDFRHIDLSNTNETTGGRYLLYEAGWDKPDERVLAFNLQDVYIKARPKGSSLGGIFPSAADEPAFAAVHIDVPPPGGSFVTANSTGGVGIAGMNYQSPGYADGGQLILQYQGENLTLTASSGDPYGPLSNYYFTDGVSGGHNGSGAYFQANAAGDYVAYTFPALQKRAYVIKVGTRLAANSGISQLAIADTPGGTYVNCGPAVDQYGSAGAGVEYDAGTYTPATAGDKVFRFTVTGKNAAASGYRLNFDYIRLVPQ